MAKSVPPYTWERGFREPTSQPQWLEEPASSESDCYVPPPAEELVTSTVHNDLGINVLRTWPTMYDGTNSPHGTPEWWNPPSEVDVLICGAGPSGLEVALSLVRQGVSFRIVDKAEGPLVAGRADGVQPRFLEILNTWGLAKEVHEEGPIIERTAIYKDGKKLFFNRSHQSDSRYRGLHIITQGQIERLYIRDLMRHKVLVERSTTLKHYKVQNDGSEYPVHATLINSRTGVEQNVRAKFLVGSDGAASQIRKSLNIPFDGMSTDIYWGIMDCIFESDYPHAWVFGSVISSKYGGCVIIPREDGYIRLYTQLDVSHTGGISQSRQAKDASFAESGGKVDVHSITPQEVLEQANRIFSPYKLKFAAPLSWFAVWKISERVARTFSSDDLRVHLVGDASHVHSVMGAFGLNASIMDASNLAWKMGLVAQNKAKFETLMATYTPERREHACRIIETSGEYLRFVCATKLDIADVRSYGNNNKSASGTKGTSVNGSAKASVNGTGQVSTNGTTQASVNGTTQASVNGTTQSSVNGTTKAITNGTHKQPLATTREEDLKFLADFFSRNGQFLLGVDAPFETSVLTPPQPTADSQDDWRTRPLRVNHGVRAPNPRVCFSTEETGYLYDKMTGAATFHILIFGSSLSGTVGKRVSAFSKAFAPGGFYHKFGGHDRFNIILVIKRLPFETDEVLSTPELQTLREYCTVVYDDRAPDEDAHTTWGANHAQGGLAVVRPDLWVGMTAFPDEVEAVEEYFDGFLLPVQ
ncbi:FAD binding domain-containing protein [Westerdykella ornata]|uniref:FAD binding domain-containing protein n=1 Tax=Westerdykella ornata TaxID=318751 RepID=A0A6A6JU51_WESOR|nr:FAD binding domain-containing protein [Westerdykella ornata]KAF2280131.1 FAD binding domain-containing protein [Westerdykella ornata]